MNLSETKQAYEEWLQGSPDFDEQLLKKSNEDDECSEYHYSDINSMYSAFDAGATIQEHILLKEIRAKQCEINELKEKLEAFEKITKSTYFLRDADYVVGDPCEYELEPLVGDVFEFEKWKRSIEEKIYIVPIFKNIDEYDLVEFSSKDEADKAALENKAMIEAIDFFINSEQENEDE